MLLSASVGLFLPACDRADGASAMTHRDKAIAEAKEWDQEAELAQVIGIEGQNWAELVEGISGGIQDAGVSRSADDTDIGDGRSEIWIYRFVSAETRDAYTVGLDEGGEVLFQEPDQGDELDLPVGEWTIDSVEAAEIAMERNPHLLRGSGAENAGIVLILGRDSVGGNATWLVAGGGGDSRGGGGGEVIVDAVTGDVLQSHGSSGGG